MVIYIVVCAAVSVIAAIYFVRTSKTPSGLEKVCFLSFAGLIPSFFFLTPAVVLQLLITLIVAITCLTFRLNRSFVKSLLIAAPIVSYGLIVCGEIAELHYLPTLRQKYPVESLAARLDYEHPRNALPKTLAFAAPQLSFTTAKQLDQFEQIDSYDSLRRDRLQMLHDRTTEQFIMAQGFGPMRMAGIAQDGWYLLDAKDGPIPLESPSANASSLPANHGASASLGQEPAAKMPLTLELLESLHLEGRDDFLELGQMGYVQDRAHVVGFQSHHFTIIPSGSDGSWQMVWRISRLELIGLLRFDKPRAYVSSNLPRLQELVHAPTRDLDTFEKAALGRLRTREDVVIDETASRIRMLGSLRAGKDCLQCHDVRRGELLGALSYELVPLKIELMSPHSVAAITVHP